LARVAAKHANLERPAVEPERSAGGVEESTSYFWLSFAVCAPVTGAISMAPSGTAQGMTEHQAGATGEYLCFLFALSVVLASFNCGYQHFFIVSLCRPPPRQY
jgi:hypothetical protein